MKIQLSSTLYKLVVREAQARGITPEQLIELALDAYLLAPNKPAPTAGVSQAASKRSSKKQESENE